MNLNARFYINVQYVFITEDADGFKSGENLNNRTFNANCDLLFDQLNQSSIKRYRSKLNTSLYRYNILIFNKK